MITRFLMMYWPSKVGVMNACHVICGRSIKGIAVVNICGINSNTPSGFNLRNKKQRPINISKRPNKIKKSWSLMNGSVFASS